MKLRPATLAEMIENLPALVEMTMVRRGLTYREVGEQTGLRHSVIHGIVHGGRDPRLSTLVVLARWLEE